MENQETGEFEGLELPSENTEGSLENAKKDFFLENLSTKGIQFSVNASGYIENLNLFEKYIGRDIYPVITEYIGRELKQGEGFIIQKVGDRIVIFSGKSHTSLFSIDMQLSDMRAMKGLKNNPDDDSFLINFDEEFEDSLPIDYD